MLRALQRRSPNPSPCWACLASSVSLAGRCCSSELMAPKRKVDANQPSLEELTDAPVVKKRTQKGKLDHPKVTKTDTAADELRAQRLKRKHGSGRI